MSCQWNAAGTEATLVALGGADFDLNVTVGGSATTQHWRIPSRSDCLACHAPQAGHALSFNTRQLNLANTMNGCTLAEAFRLSAPTAQSKSDITLAGAQVSPNGTWAPGAAETVTVADNTATLTLPPASAALVRLR